MNLTKQISEERRKLFSQKFWDVGWIPESKEEVLKFQDKTVKETVERVIKHAIDLSNKVEIANHNSPFEEWKGFKHFRNTLRDELKELES